MQPCKNPQCRSFGKVHPNCRCGSGHSDGGEVSHFCESGKSHNPDCEYFADGGPVPGFDEMPGSEAPQEGVPSFDELPGGQPQAVEQAGQVPSFDEIPSVQAPTTEPPKETDYVEQAKAGAEGLARGLLGDAAKYAEIKSGISTKENIEQREKDYPATQTVAKTVGRVAPFVLAPEIAGSKLLANMLIGVSYAASDNITKSLLDQPGSDPTHAVASSLIDGGIDGLTYTLTDGLFSGLKGAKFLQDPKIVRAAEDAMIGLADKPVNKGINAAVVKGLGKTGQGFGTELLEYDAIKKYIQPYIEKTIGKPLSKANAYVSDAILNQLIKTNYFGIPSAIRYAQKIAAGEAALSPAIEGLFKAGTQSVHDAAKPNEKGEENIRKWQEAGGIDKEVADQMGPQPGDHGFAAGGEIPAPQAFAKAYPTHNMLLNATRARVSNYLNSVRPLPEQAKPFDSQAPQKDKKRQYDRAIRIAANPLSVLKNVDSGDLTTDDMKHLNQMYPEVYSHMAARMTKRITEAQLKGEKPTYRKRQAMSLFLGTELDSTFTPAAIATIQGMYQAKGAAQQPQAQKPKKSTSPLSKMAPMAMSDAQARTNREQNQKA